MSIPGGRAELVHFYIMKSDNTLKDAKLLANNNSWDSCVNRLYYACFYIVYALIVKKIGKRTKTHSGIKALFNEHFIKEGILSKQVAVFYGKLMSKRALGDYDDFQVLTAGDVIPLIPQTEAFINTIKSLIV